MIKLLQNCPLFKDIDGDGLESLVKCLDVKRKKYGKGEYIFLEGDKVKFVGIMLSGAAQVIKDDFWGNRTIISNLGAGDLFGESFASSDTESGVSVVPTEISEILLIDYTKVITYCPSSCGFHSKLIKNMLAILASKNVMLTEKIEIITKRTMREKILAYLSSVAKRKSGAVTLPYNRQELADFLSVDRSALSRELGAMKADGLIDFHGNIFILKSGV